MGVLGQAQTVSQGASGHWCSTLRKTSLILSALTHLVPNPSPTPLISFHALDLEKHELKCTLMELNASEVGAELKSKVITASLCSMYDNGLQFIEEG